MIKLKTILLSNSSKYIHISFLITILLFSIKQPLLLVLLTIYIFILFRLQKSLVYIFVIIVLLIGARLIQLEKHHQPELPMEAKIIKVDDGQIIVKSNKKYLVYVDQPNSYEPGMIVYIEGTTIQIDEMHVKHQMSYEAYLKTQNIYGLIAPSKIEIISNARSIYQLPFIVGNEIDRRYEEKVGQYLKLFILGDKTAIDEEIYHQSQAIGISHLFAISGMHVAIILGLFHYLMRFFYFKRKTHHMLMGLFLLLYNALTGFSISIIRASFLSFLLFFKYSSQYFSKSDILSFIFIGLIIYHPLLMYYVGFQLSFIISCVILLTQSKKQLSRFKQLLYISFLASLFSLPIIVSMNHAYGLLNIILNPIFIVFVSFGLLPGALVILIFPQLSFIYLHIISAFEQLIGVVHRMNIYINFGFSFWLYILVYWFLLIISIKYMKSRRKQIVSYWLMFILFCFIISPNQYVTKVMIFDVNQGDAIYIQSQACNILIDTGKADDYNTLINYFNGENIRHLSAMILTHAHSDHIGESLDLIEALNIQEIYVSREIEYLNSFTQKTLSKGDKLSCGRFKLTVLSAFQDDSNDNNNSLVILSNIGEETWLFTGDIEAKVETELLHELPENITHLKVPHHGSNTSSTEAFIKKLNPEFAYVSFGKNSYGIPSNDVINRLIGQGSKIYTTYDMGTIEVIYLDQIRIYQFHHQRRKIYFEYRR